MIIFVEIARTIVPLLIFDHTLVAIILNLILDNIDGQLFYKAGYKWKTYNLVDKTMDFWWYLWILFYLWSTPVYPIALILIIYRSLGQIGSIIFSNEKIFLFFPNILEWFFYIYLLQPKYIGPNLAVSVVIAIIVEFIIHNSRAHITSKYLWHDEITWKK